MCGLIQLTITYMELINIFSKNTNLQKAAWSLALITCWAAWIPWLMRFFSAESLHTGLVKFNWLIKCVRFSICPKKSLPGWRQIAPKIASLVLLETFRAAKMEETEVKYWLESMISWNKKWESCVFSKAWYSYHSFSIINLSNRLTTVLFNHRSWRQHFVGVHSIFFQNFPNFAWKTFAANFLSQIFCSCWYIIFSFINFSQIWN